LIPLFDGLQMARLIHHVSMWIVLIFAVMHIYFVVLASLAERIGTFDSIVSGYKFLSKRKAGVR
jgi:Ni/Fe-hydrogenase 1 B-type cytochrome subunit